VYTYVESVDQSRWEEVLKVASSLLVELSTFPTYFLPGDGLLEEEEPRDNVNLPKWLKVLIVCSCFLNVQPSLQLTSIATLLDLIALSKAHSDSARQTHGEGVTTVVIVPLLKQWHIAYLKNYTDVFQVRRLEFSLTSFLTMSFNELDQILPRTLQLMIQQLVSFSFIYPSTPLFAIKPYTFFLYFSIHSLITS
jgi:hypothetical protein